MKLAKRIKFLSTLLGASLLWIASNAQSSENYLASIENKIAVLYQEHSDTASLCVDQISDLLAFLFKYKEEIKLIPAEAEHQNFLALLTLPTQSDILGTEELLKANIATFMERTQELAALAYQERYIASAKSQIADLLLPSIKHALLQFYDGAVPQEAWNEQRDRILDQTLDEIAESRLEAVAEDVKKLIQRLQQDIEADQKKRGLFEGRVVLHTGSNIPAPWLEDIYQRLKKAPELQWEAIQATWKEAEDEKRSAEEERKKNLKAAKLAAYERLARTVAKPQA